MRVTIVMSLALALGGPALKAQAPAEAPAASCTCAAAFERVVTGVETDYAGFQIKVDAERREAYDRFKALLKADAAGAGPDRCKEVLDTYVAFFQDLHLFVLRGSKAGGPAGTASRRWTELEARGEIDRQRERLDAVEGLWYSREGRYAVLRDTEAAAGTFVAVRLAADGTASNEVAAVLRRVGDGGYRATYRDGEGQWQVGAAALHRNGALLALGIQGWGRLYPAVPQSRLDPADPQAPLFTRLEAGILYLSLPSFAGIYRQPLADLLAAHGEEMAKARGLVLDLRGNAGGDAIYFDLAPYLLSGPIVYWEDNAILASANNREYMERLREAQGEQGAWLDPALKRMRENPGKLVPYLDRETYTPPALHPGPQKVALLIDGGVGSAAEAMVLHARQSARVTVVGENSRGNIDYQQANLVYAGCGDHTYLLGTPLYMRTRQLPAGALDGVGITPDVPVPDHLVDPVEFAVRLVR